MLFLACLALLLSLLPLPLSASTIFPLPNGFPDIENNATVTSIQKASGGHYGTYPPAAKLDKDDVISWGVVAFSNLFTIAFYTELITNITTHAPGYCLPPEKESYVLASLNKFQAIEELHYFDSEDATTRFGGTKVLPCSYDFPVHDFDSASTYAATFTGLILAHFADQEQRTVDNLGAGAAAIVFNLAGWSGEMGQQNGWLRSLLGKLPSVQPVLTPTTRDLLYSFFQQTAVVSGSCQGTPLPVKLFEPLDLVTEHVVDGPVSFRLDEGRVKVDEETQSVVFVNGNTAPLVVPFNVTSTTGSSVEIVANFPHDEWFMDGLTIATVVEGNGPFDFPRDVANATLYGPAIIDVE